MFSSQTNTNQQFARQSQQLAQQFPSFQLDAAKVAQGSVRVEARAPSGAVRDMEVAENQGVFTANFTPTEVGKYKYSFLSTFRSRYRIKICTFL